MNMSMLKKAKDSKAAIAAMCVLSVLVVIVIFSFIDGAKPYEGTWVSTDDYYEEVIVINKDTLVNVTYGEAFDLDKIKKDGKEYKFMVTTKALLKMGYNTAEISKYFPDKVLFTIRMVDKDTFLLNDPYMENIMVFTKVD